ncbi:unnamed protein product [Heligmosomoides polygyrus]|uniref:Uncharacterized protein n=1 Tax=Heligmosomoides polygyrus TaxID=6339 RepID=A0A183GT18_HELPZ|nr:unnamed protein product [Heligmosomoides polygyrus]
MQGNSSCSGLVPALNFPQDGRKRKFTSLALEANIALWFSPGLATVFFHDDPRGTISLTLQRYREIVLCEVNCNESTALVMATVWNG